ncbi:anti-sigma factor antagonist [Gluconobacter sp. Dm-62]|uniref:STAS domain-containing protein n=1 Tax=Gluconobacter sp. Dm-62 TaxID=2799804 RepID=UPI001B8BB890|nr:STAS domain-containing protein [Gluconobacter sp. Dm-62]MBS1103807.1 anti-sigma factor antagonist [Gluconobacter sp. Dm-62]
MGVLILPEVLDTKYADSFLELLKSERDSILLDGSYVSRVGGLCFQLIVSAYRTAHAQNISFEIRNISDAMKENLSLMGGDFLLLSGDEA